MEFAEITEDPFVNNTNNYFLVLEIQNHNTPTSSSTSEVNGELDDPNGSNVGYHWIALSYDYEVTGSLSDEAYAHSWSLERLWTLVPPKFTFKTFGIAIGFWLTSEEVKQFILGRLSLKGGD